MAFVAAGAGAVVAKHGNRSKSRAGSADVLEALGVNLAPTDAQIEASFRDARVAFMFAQQHHTRNEARRARASGARHAHDLQHARPARESRRA